MNATLSLIKVYIPELSSLSFREMENTFFPKLKLLIFSVLTMDPIILLPTELA